MNGPAATYGFLPWMRRGVSTGITRVDGSATPVAARTTFPVTLVFNGQTADEEVTTFLDLHGPGEVVGVDPRMIVRVDPSPGTTNVESNYFPLIEFDQPDFPWRYTPAAATAGDRLRPWLVLIVLSDAEIVPPAGARAPRSLPTITVNVEHLPDLDQSWAWAHVQVAGVDPGFAFDDQVARIIEEAPSRVVSRLLCARHLKPNTAYTAYLVPSFERGCLAGRNLDVPEAIDALTPAWPSSDPSVVLPVYYQWRFQTGAAGDFESLVRQLLPPRPLTGAVGWRAMDGSAPGADLPAVTAGGAPLAMEGALMSAGARDNLPPRNDQPAFVAELERLLNRSDDLVSSLGGVPAVAPPLYGRWHAARRRIRAAAILSWFDEVNRDPRLRAVAGLGTRVVQEQQEPLLAAAWDQVEGIRAANKQRREAELGAAVAGRLIERDWLALEPETTVQISAPILARILASPTTIRAALERSPIPAGVLEPQFRRLTRPLGPIGRRQARASSARGRFGGRVGPTGKILKRMNKGELALPKPPKGTRLKTLAGISERLAPPQSTMKRLALPTLLLLAMILLVWAAISGLAAPAAAAVGLGIAAAAFWWISRREARRLGLLRRLASGTLTAAEVRRASAASTFTPRGFVEGAPGAVSRSEATANFQVALAGLADRLRPGPPEPAAKPAANFQHLHDRIMKAVRPEQTVTAAMNRRLHFDPTALDSVRAPRAPEDSGPVMAAPEFQQPMYEPLRQLSQDWLLPGVREIPPDTVTLVVSNQRFIEAYMLGLNHEMARELLWHEYPTDQRGTYFRQFWDVRGYAGPPGQDLRDIDAVTKWTAATALGTHRGSPPPPGGFLVLLIRGQLLKRYPKTVIYAVRALLNGTDPVARGGQRTLGEEAPRYPLFRGSLEPDITFLGFDLGYAEVVGDDSSAAPERQGWFFVLEEPPTGPRFGLEVKPAILDSPFAAWDGLSWRDLVIGEQELETMSYIDLTTSLPSLPANPPLAWHAAQGSRASDIASITLQKPYRVAVHGSDMLPPPGA